jgi:Autophagy-related protein 2 CAD motif
VVPNELTRIHVNLADVSVHVEPPSLPSVAVVTLGHLDLKTDLMPDQPFTVANVSLSDARVLLIDEAAALTAADETASTTSQFWQVRFCCCPQVLCFAAVK